MIPAVPFPSLLRLAAYVFVVIFIAELPDKTALSALVLATRHRPWPVFLGASLALTVQSVVAVVAGSAFALLPPRAVHVGAGIAFLVSALVLLLRPAEESAVDPGRLLSPAGHREATAGSPVRLTDATVQSFATSFAVVFAAEWGDITQFATAALAARERAPVVVCAASALALWAAMAIAVTAGNRAARVLRPALVQRLAGVLFLLVAAAMFLGAP